MLALHSAATVVECGTSTYRARAKYPVNWAGMRRFRCVVGWLGLRMQLDVVLDAAFKL